MPVYTLDEIVELIKAWHENPQNREEYEAIVEEALGMRIEELEERAKARLFSSKFLNKTYTI